MDASIIWLPSLTTIPPRISGSTVRVDRDVAAGAGAKLLLQRGELIVVERTSGDDLGGRLAAMLGGKPAEGADDGPKLVLAAVPGEDAEEIRRDRIESELRRKRGERLAGFVARDQRAATSSAKSRESSSAWLSARGCGRPRRSAVRRGQDRTERTRSALLSWPECRRMSPRAKSSRNWNLPHAKNGALKRVSPARPHGLRAPLARGCAAMHLRHAGRVWP